MDILQGLSLGDGSIILACSFRRSPHRCSTLRLKFDFGEAPQLALRFTPNQA
jgi:hypothetical protein